MLRQLQAISAALLLLAALSALAAPQALTRTFEDPQLQWGPCPDFIPQGCKIAVLHGGPSQPNADVFFKVPANFRIPWHSHTSPERMVLVSGKLRVQYQGQPATVLEPGMYAYGPANVPHEAVCAAEAPCVLFIAFEAAVDAFPKDPSGERRTGVSPQPRPQPDAGGA